MRLKTLKKYRLLFDYQALAKAVALFAFWCAGMMLWYKFLFEAVN